MARYKITYKDGTTNEIIAAEDFCKDITKDGGSYELIAEPALTDDEIKLNATAWRNIELEATDIVSQTSDYGKFRGATRDEVIAYRTALRAWTGTADFPDKKPTLGS
tara:strand:+ start:18594 stop:18914 length:321 start_codon:yes stop_codon:yes gene_type:complete